MTLKALYTLAFKLEMSKAADSSEAQARTNLRRELHHLRQVLAGADRFLQTDAKTRQWRHTYNSRLGYDTLHDF